MSVCKLECNFLSQDVNSELQTVQNVIEQLFEDLNSYCECQIPISKISSEYVFVPDLTNKP